MDWGRIFELGESMPSRSIRFLQNNNQTISISGIRLWRIDAGQYETRTMDLPSISQHRKISKRKIDTR